MTDIVIIGAGITGLATAYTLKQHNKALKIVVLEKNKSIAQHQTSNNSGVIHAGIYYKPGSLKASNCIEGYKMLIEFCNNYNIKYELCGKLIVATHQNEINELTKLYNRGLQNGLSKIKLISAEQIKEYEPYSMGVSAIHVPYTGIINYSEVAQKLAEIFYNHQYGAIYCNHQVNDIHFKGQNIEVITPAGNFNTKLVINTAGLFSDRIAALSGNYPNIQIIPFRGEYYKLKEEKNYLIRNLIYPVPNVSFPFLGVHFTRHINGSIEAGPNAVWAFKREGYKKNSFSAHDTLEALAWPGFRKVIKKYWREGLNEYMRSVSKNKFTLALKQLIPDIEQNDLIPGGAGIRAQACDKAGNLIDDFVIMQNTGMLNVLNAPSPAATACLAVANTISNKALNML